MSQTPEGAKAAAATNKAKYGDDFFAKIGRRGGQNGKTGGFGQGEAGRERARKAGRIGGLKSKRRKSV